MGRMRTRLIPLIDIRAWYDLNKVGHCRLHDAYKMGSVSLTLNARFLAIYLLALLGLLLFLSTGGVRFVH